jgi:hypothetical protein
MPRPGPRRPIVALRLDAEGIAYLDERANSEELRTEKGEPNRSELVRIMIAYARENMPPGWRPTP